jgi:hypothetical protein
MAGVMMIFDKTRRAFLAGLVTFFLAGQVKGAIGDNPIAVPATFKTAHPRLPSPGSTYLTNLANNPTSLAAYNATADSWSSTSPQGSWQLRRLVIAYLANQIANPTKAATYLAKITALADLGGSWGPLLYKVNDGVGTGTYTLTSASANFLTGCSGGSCLGNILSIEARAYNIVGVPDAHTVILGNSNPVLTGTNLKIRIFSYLNEADLNIALIYDWLYSDLDTATRTEFMNELDVLCTEWEENYVGLQASPYNDQFYIELGTFGMLGALTIYQDDPNGQKHMNFMTDVWFNTLLPVWKQILGPEGGGWHESYQDYVIGANGNGLNTFILPSLLSWQTATGDPILTRESWVKNFAYFTMYLTRPDFILENIGDSSRDTLVPESPALCSLSGLGEVYNDPVLRGWARVVNSTQPMAALDGFEPSTWPFYTPDNKTNPVSTRAALPPVRNFTGWGFLSMRTGWTENDTSATLKYGDNFWSHEHFDAGSFTIFSRGNLALDSGSYRSGSLSEHENQYARQTIAHNTLTVTDPADVYPTTFLTYDNLGNTEYLAPPNDGGQRRAGTLYNSQFPQFVSPNNIGGRMQNWDYYHMGTMVAFASAPNYTYTAVDITAAYNNKFSATTPNATNRTYRVQKAVRHMLFIPRGTTAYVVIFDQVNSTNASFVKKWILHTVNQPVISGNSFQVTRNELITSLPFAGLWPEPFESYLQHTSGPANNSKYQYDGKLYGWMVQPSSASISSVGGPGKEFWVEDPLNPGNGTNWSHCMQGQCPANTEGLGTVNDVISPISATAPHEPGSWRIEEKPSNPATQDYFLNVMLATTTEDTSLPANVTVPAGLATGNVGATWTEGGKTYTITLPQSGVGGHITISGVIDESLLTHAQQLPFSMQVASGTPQSAAASAAVPQPLTVTVLDNSGNPVPNATVHFGITQGNGVLSSESATTGSNGQGSVTLTLGTGAAGSVTSVMADVNGLQPVEFDITISGGSTPPALAALVCTPANVPPSSESSCTVTLATPAGASGVTITLSSNSANLTVPPTVTVAANATSTSFTATAGPGVPGQTATVTASYLGVSQSSILTFASAVLSGISCSPSSVTAGGASSCTVTLSQQAPSGGAAITLSSNVSGVSVPAAVQVSAGATNAVFAASTASGIAAQVAVLTASYGGVSQTTSLSVGAVGGSGLPISVNTWVTVPTNGFPEAVVGYDNMVYAPGIKKFLMWENYHNLTSETNEAMLAYDFTLNRWDVVGLNGNFHSESLPESGHEVGMLQYDPNQNIFLNYCCHSGSQGYERPEHTWLYDPVGNVGRDMQTPTMPGLTTEAQAAFDSADNVYVLFDRGAGTWVYSPTANSWTQMKPNGTPPTTSGYFGAMAYDSTNNKLYLFGGTLGNGTYANDLYMYDVPSNTWTKLAPSGTPPSARQYPGFSFDSTDNVFLLFGGQNTSILNDTWIYDPTANKWTQLTPVVSPPVPTQATFQRLAYDPNDNVFVMVASGTGGYANGISTGYAAQTWFYRYKGSGPNVGTLSTTFTPTSGSVNRNTDAWANEPVLASSGTSIYAGWIETGRPFDNGNVYFPHVFASQFSNSTWNPMGTSYLSLDSELSGFDEAHAPSMAVVNGVPWISWYKTNNAGTLLPNSLYAKYWNGSAWVGGAVGGVDITASLVIQNRSQLIGVGNVPYVAFLENDRSCYPWCQYLYVKQWNGTAWSLTGPGPLNRNTKTTTLSPLADSVSITSDGTHPLVAWTEDALASTFQGTSAPQLYVDVWSGSAWTALGGSLNQSASGWAYDASITYAGGQPYVAWVERSQAGLAQLYVKSWNGTAWSLVGGGSLNINKSTGWAFRPSLVSDSTGTLYIAWVEQPNLGQIAQAYVAKYSGTAWSLVGGGSLNADPSLGSAERVGLAILNGQPIAAWGEVKPGSLRQVFIKQWNGSAWTLTSSGSAAVSNTPPVVSITSPTNGSSISGTVTVVANATDNVGVTAVQFQLDGANFGTASVSAPRYSVAWNTTSSANGPHRLSATASDAAGNKTVSSINVTVNNAGVSSAPPAPAISAVTANSTTSSSATISWTTDVASTSQVVYGTNSTYGSTSPLSSTLVTSHLVTLSGLSVGTTYHYQVQSSNSDGLMSVSADFTFAIGTGAQSSLLLHADGSEVTGVANGATVTPSVGPLGFTGTVIVSGTGSVNYTPAESGNGVYFLNCCTNTNAAYYKFTGAEVGSVFNTAQGQISFYLKSRYSFAQRQANAATPRYTFDVRDGNGTHLFAFLTQIMNGSLQFTYIVGGVAQYYFVPAGTEDTLYGSGVLLSVTLKWSSSGMSLWLNGTSVKASSYTPVQATWTAGSNFDLGAYEYLTAGGYDISDDIIDEFSVTPPASSVVNKCDLNSDGVVNVVDVAIAISQALGNTPCGSADLQSNGTCNVIDVQRIVAASLGGQCIVGN